MYNHAMQSVHQIETPTGQLIRLIHGDITRATVDAIVNAANAQLQHGGGVAGAISRAGGPTIQAESDQWVQDHGFISHTSPAITTGGDLPCGYVIHVVGPIWGEGDEDQKLTSAVQSALQLADQREFQSLALPAISTGIYGFPKDRGAQVILDALMEYYATNPKSTLEQIDITLIDEPSATIFATEFMARWSSDS
jgi:O-acetyl-ADP-ribose deacetylase (regulator of RNase III)